MRKSYVTQPTQQPAALAPSPRRGTSIWPAASALKLPIGGVSTLIPSSGHTVASLWCSSCAQCKSHRTILVTSSSILIAVPVVCSTTMLDPFQCWSLRSRWYLPWESSLTQYVWRQVSLQPFEHHSSWLPSRVEPDKALFFLFKSVLV